MTPINSLHKCLSCTLLFSCLLMQASVYTCLVLVLKLLPLISCTRFLKLCANYTKCYCYYNLRHTGIFRVQTVYVPMFEEPVTKSKYGDHVPAMSNIRLRPPPIPQRNPFRRYPAYLAPPTYVLSEINAAPK